MFPVIKQWDTQNINKLFKQLKELKTAYSQYGPTAPFTQVILKTIVIKALPSVS